MSRSSRGIPVRLLRWSLLVTLVVFVLSVAALYVIGRMGRPSESRPVADLDDEERQEQLVLSGKGFDYGLTRGDREIFRVQASRILSDRNNNYELEGVELTMAREDGSVYRLISDRALYNLDTQEATFRGSVRFSGPREVKLTADGLELREEGDLLVSSSPVRFWFLGRYTGTANRLRISPSRNLFILAGDVKVDTLPGDATPMSLRCRRFSFDRDEHQLRAEGEVVLTRSNDILMARRLSVILTEDDRTTEFVQARWNVRAKMEQVAGDGQISIVEIAGRELSVLFDTSIEEPRTAELQASDTRPARVAVTDSTGLRRRIWAHYLVGDFESGALSKAQAFDSVEIREFLAFDPTTVIRSACADRAVATLSPAGELNEVQLEGTVLLRDGNVQAFGDQARAEMSAGRMVLLGEPAWLLRDGEQLQAPRIVYDQIEEEILAEGGSVRAVLTSGDEMSLATHSRTRSEPIRIEAQRAKWLGRPSTVSFSGQVRAWQGENFLLSDRLTGELETSRVRASGRVKSVWRPEPRAEPGDEALPPEPLEVTADEMEYRRTQRLLVYSGNARAVQLKRTLRCREIYLHLTEDDGFEQMICEGTTHLVDEESGNTVTGERAIYRPGESTATVEGTPVILRDRKGTEIQGKVLIYDFATATARIQSAPAPTGSPVEDP